MNEFEFDAYAKINLFLEVCGKRSDGYHELLTIFSRISVADKLIFKKRHDSNINIILKNNVNLHNLSKENNLIWKAAKHFVDKFNIKEGFDIYVEKNIPAGAGLGGGSSDCAKTLEAMCLMYGIDKKNVFDIANNIGSDIAFFLSDFKFALGRGRGEMIEGINVSANMPDLIVVFPGISISTKDVYMAMNYDYEPKYELFELFLEELKGRQKINFSKYLFNRLENPAFNIEERIRKLKEEISFLGLDALMSGSGSCVFGLSYNNYAIENAFNILSSRYNFVFKAKFV